MTMRIDLTKETLTEDEQTYIDSRSWLAREREQVLATLAAGGEVSAAARGEVEDDDVHQVTVEEWVAQASKAEVIAELKDREVEHDPKSRKADLDRLLINAVHEAEAEDEDESSE